MKLHYRYYICFRKSVAEELSVLTRLSPSCVQSGSKYARFLSTQKHLITVRCDLIKKKKKKKNAAYNCAAVELNARRGNLPDRRCKKHRRCRYTNRNSRYFSQ